MAIGFETNDTGITRNEVPIVLLPSQKQRVHTISQDTIERAHDMLRRQDELPRYSEKMHQKKRFKYRSPHHRKSGVHSNGKIVSIPVEEPGVTKPPLPEQNSPPTDFQTLLQSLKLHFQGHSQTVVSPPETKLPEPTPTEIDSPEVEEKPTEKLLSKSPIDPRLGDEDQLGGVVQQALHDLRLQGIDPYEDREALSQKPSARKQKAIAAERNNISRRRRRKMTW